MAPPPGDEIDEDALDAASQLILSHEGQRLWERLAPGWLALGWLRRATLVRFTLMCSFAGGYWDALRASRAAEHAPVKGHFAGLAEKARQATRESAAALGLLKGNRIGVAELNSHGEDVDLVQLFEPGPLPHRRGRRPPLRTKRPPVKRTKRTPLR
jgi:hypothetical protein